MKQPVIKLYYEIRVGRRVVKRAISRSFVQAFTQMMFVQMSQSSVSITDTSNSTTSQATGSFNFTATASSGTATQGIQAGTSSTAVAISDHVLGTLIAHGTGSGQLSYGTSLVQTLSVSASPATFQLQRVFTNNSGSTITVQEVGFTLGSASHIYLGVRDVTGGVAIGNGQTMTVTYTWSAAI